MGTFTFLTSNIDAILAVLAGLHALAIAITNLTPTPRDDKLVGEIYKVIEVMAGIFGRRAKEWPGEKEAEDKLDALPDVDAWLYGDDN